MTRAWDMAGIMSNSSFGRIPSGSTANRPASPAVGDQYYNGTIGALEVYTSDGWKTATTPSGDTAGRPSSPYVGQPYFNGETARLELYTETNWQNIVQETPGVTSISGNYSEETNSGTITISGTNFVSGCFATAIGSNGIAVDATSTTFNSIVQVTAAFSGLSSAYEPYDIKVTNPSNLFGLIPDALYVNNSPVWVTSSGSLGTFTEEASITLSALSATDSDSTITYSLASGSSLPSGLSLNSSTGVISGTLPVVSSNTTYSFSINATDGVNTIPRSFSLISKNKITWNTSDGSLGSIYDSYRSDSSFQISASGSSSVSYSLVSGSLPSGMSLSSSGLISGAILSSVSSDTTYTFTARASDGVFADQDREFSILLKAPVVAATLTYTGADQDFTLPNGIKRFNVYMWGAGGGGERSVSPNGGGSGGYVSGFINTEDSTFVSTYGANKNSFKAVVGRGANRNGYFQGTNRNPFYGGGGYAKDLYNGTGGEIGDGGGLTGLFVNVPTSVYSLSGTRDTSSGSYTVASGVTSANVIAIAGGGGGAGDSFHGGAGGGLIGGSDASGGSPGGTQSSGGSGTTNSQGLFLLGGATYDVTASTSASVRAGAGGGGYYGGAGADGDRNGGGGGSSYVGILAQSVNTQGSMGVTAGVNPPQTSNGFYPSDGTGVAVGFGGPGNNTQGHGGHGAIVITY